MRLVYCLQYSKIDQWIDHHMLDDIAEDALGAVLIFD